MTQPDIRITTVEHAQTGEVLVRATIEAVRQDARVDFVLTPDETDELVAALSEAAESARRET